MNCQKKKKKQKQSAEKNHEKFKMVCITYQELLSHEVAVGAGLCQRMGSRVFQAFQRMTADLDFRAPYQTVAD